MNEVRMVGNEAWCSRPYRLDCRRAEPLAILQGWTEDGTECFARLISTRWRREGWEVDEEGGRRLERYRMISGKHSSKIVRVRRDGSKRFSRNLQMRAPLPAFLVCSCGRGQVMEPGPRPITNGD